MISIRIPPLRERREDIPDLVEHFIEFYRTENGLPEKSISDEALDLLMSYDWPGNVRELENAIERAVVIGEGEVIRPGDLPRPILAAGRAGLLRTE